MLRHRPAVQLHGPPTLVLKTPPLRHDEHVVRGLHWVMSLVLSKIGRRMRGSVPLPGLLVSRFYQFGFSGLLFLTQSPTTSACTVTPSGAYCTVWPPASTTAPVSTLKTMVRPSMDTERRVANADAVITSVSETGVACA